MQRCKKYYNMHMYFTQSAQSSLAYFLKYSVSAGYLFVVLF